jgi:putative Mn2+ efflux pump MntP
VQIAHYVLSSVLAVIGIGCLIAGIVGEALDKVYYLDTNQYWFLIAIAVSVLAVSCITTALYHSQKL